MDSYETSLSDLPILLEGEDMQVTFTCQPKLTNGDQPTPDSVKLFQSGQQLGTTETNTDDITRKIGTDHTGTETLEGKCYWGLNTSQNPDNRVGKETQTVTISEPAELTLVLRNLTQDDEPPVTDQGPITYTIDDTTITDPDSTTLEVRPGQHDIFAFNDNFYDAYGTLKRATQPKFERLAHRDSTTFQSIIRVEEDQTIEIYKFKKDDIRDTGYTLEDVDTVLDNDVCQPGINRFTQRTIPTFVDTTDSDTLNQSGIDEVKRWGTSDEPRYGPKALTDGYIKQVKLRDQKPDKPWIKLKFKENDASLAETINEQGEITNARIHLFADRTYEKGDPIATTEYTQALGLPDDIGQDLRDDLLNFDQGRDQFIYSDLGMLSGKIAYRTPVGFNLNSWDNRDCN